MANGDDDVLEQLEALDEQADNLPGLKVQIENLRAEFKKATDAQQKRAIAAALPNIAKGLLSAVTAFQQTPPDAISGSAAIMDMLAGVSAAIGPEGALVGALFSMISMILNFFAPKQPSLIEQIETLLRNLEAEDWKEKLTAVGQAVDKYANVCDSYMTPADPDNPNQHNGVQDPGPLTVEVSKVNLVEGNSALTIFTAQEWLKIAANQELDAWPAILNLHCELYMRLRLAVTRQYFYVSDPDRRATYIDDGADGCQARSNAWEALRSQMDPKFRNMALGDVDTLDFLNIIVPVARKRGLHMFQWQLSVFGSGDLQVATGPKAYREANVQTLRGACRVTSITPPRTGVNDAAALYDVWILDKSSRATHATLNLETRALSSPPDDLGPDNDGTDQFADWWPMPNPGDADTFSIFVAVDTSNWENPGGILEQYEWNRTAKSFTRASWQPGAAHMMSQVRVVTPSAALPDDPDKKAKMPDQIIYAKVDGSDKLFAWFNGQQRFVQIPWAECRGISVDPHFLWLYGENGIVCTSHASVVSHPDGEPYWIGTRHGWGTTLLDLSTCEDGTILIIASDADHASCATYHVDYTRGEDDAIVIGLWEDIPGGGGIRCQKLPIFGWSRVRGLQSLLSEAPTSGRVRR